MRDRLLKTSTNVEDIHVHSKILCLSLVSYCIEVAQELEVLEHFKHNEEHRAAAGFA